MKIVIATPIYPPEIGGPATYTKEIVSLLAKEHEVTVVAYTDDTRNPEGATLLSVSKQSRLPVRLWRFFKAVRKAAKEADVLYVQNAMAAGLPTVLAGKLTGTPVVLKFVGDESWERATQHNLTSKRLQAFLESPEENLKIKLMRKLQGWVLRQAMIVTTPSQYLGEVIQSAYRITPGRVITNYNAVEIPTEAPFTEEKKPHQLVATARLVAWKGIDGIIKAVARLKQDYPDVHLVVHGDGPSRAEYEELTRTLQLENHVTFTGNVSRTQTWHTRKVSGVYVLNSTYEGLPHTALTSFAAKIPIVATDISGTNEAVYHEKTGLLVEPNNPEQLATAIVRLFEDPTLQTTLVDNAWQSIHDKFSWEAHTKKLLELFDTVVSKPVN